MAITEPWQTAEIAGPLKANTITKPEVVSSLVKKSKRPILVVGHKVVEKFETSSDSIDCIIALAKAGNITLVATAHVVKDFLQRGYHPSASMPAVDIANRLRDPSWRGLDDKGPYDLLLILGIPYYMEWLILSGLKHFAQDLIIISLDRFYQPHATWSFPNISFEKWQENFNVIIDKLRGKHNVNV